MKRDIYLVRPNDAIPIGHGSISFSRLGMKYFFGDIFFCSNFEAKACLYDRPGYPLNGHEVPPF